jgi:hypothetical protein
MLPVCRQLRCGYEVAMALRLLSRLKARRVPNGTAATFDEARVAFEHASNLLRRNRFSAPGMPPYYQPGRTTSPERLAAPGQSHARVVLSESPLVFWELIGRCRLELCCFVGVG